VRRSLRRGRRIWDAGTAIMGICARWGERVSEKETTPQKHGKKAP